MKPAIMLTAAITAALGLSIAAHARAEAPADNSSTSVAYAQLAGDTDSTPLQMYYLEQAMLTHVGEPSRFGPLQARYWQQVMDTDHFARAVNFYTRLKLTHPDNANVLASHGNALGGLMKWLRKQNTDLPDAVFAGYVDTAMDDYGTALEHDPDNFSALLGRAIFRSHVPDKWSAAEADFKHILELQDDHPHYPYALVYRQWSEAAKRNDHSEEATRIMKRGRDSLGADAFEQSSSR